MRPGPFAPFRRRQFGSQRGGPFLSASAPAIPNTPSPTNGGDNVYYAFGWQSAGQQRADIFLGTTPFILTPYANAVLVDAPIGYWRLGELSGTTAADSGSGNHAGTYTGGCALGQNDGITDVGQAAVLFDGTSGYVDMGNVSALKCTGAFSLEAWFSTTSAAFRELVAQADETGTTGGYVLRLTSGGKIRFILVSSTGVSLFSVTTTLSYNDGNLHHVAATWDGTTNANGVTIYIDGLSVITGTASAGTPGTPAVPFRIAAGGNSLTATLPWQGVADEVAFYSGALSSARVAAHFAAASVAVPSPVVTHAVGFASPIPTLTPVVTPYYWQVVAYNTAGVTLGPQWTFVAYPLSKFFMTVAGQRFENYARRQDDSSSTLTVHDTISGQANSGAITFQKQVVGGEDVQVGLGGLDAAHLLFAGEVQTPVAQFDEVPANIKWVSDLIDYSYALNKHRPYGSWTSVSATTIALYLAANYASGFTTNHVQNYLPAITIAFDGTQDFLTCWKAIAAALTTLTATATGDVDYVKDLHLFIGTESDAIIPDALDYFNQTLQIGTLTFTTDLSQVRTRVFGRGAGTTIPTALTASETIVPLADSTQFNTSGGLFSINNTLVLSYSGVSMRAGQNAPTLIPAGGSGVNLGTHQYAFLYKTAAGTSLLTPVASITLTTTTAPSSAPLVSATAGNLGGPTPGVYQYATTYLAGGGESTPSPLASFTVFDATNPSTAPTLTLVAGVTNLPAGTLTIAYAWASSNTFVTGSLTNQTLISAQSNSVVITDNLHAVQIAIPAWNGGTPQPVDAFAVLYYYFNGTLQGQITQNGGGFGLFQPSACLPGATPTWVSSNNYPQTSTPSSNTLQFRAVGVQWVNVAPMGASTVNLYRTVVGGSQLKLCASGLGSSGSFGDSVPDGSLGANVPVSNTAVIQQVTVGSLTPGPPSVTARDLYRTPANSSQFQFLTEIADNTTTSYLDSTTDALLGATPPTVDTSMMTTVATTTTNGTAAISASSLTVVSNSAFPTQGWLNVGSQYLRYSGKSGTTGFTGIPALGPGSIQSGIGTGVTLSAVSSLLGVNNNNGIPFAFADSAAVNVFVQCDSLVAQNALGLLELDKNGNPTDGIHEDTFVDTTQGLTQLTASCNALLAKYSMPIVTANYVTSDPKTRSGRTVQANFVLQGIFDPAIFDPAIFDDGRGVVAPFLIQDAAVSKIGFSDNAYPLYTVTAASTLFTLQNLLQNVQLQ